MKKTLKPRNPFAQALGNPLYSRKRIVPDKTKYDRRANRSQEQVID